MKTFNDEWRFGRGTTAKSFKKTHKSTFHMPLSCKCQCREILIPRSDNRYCITELTVTSHQNVLFRRRLPRDAVCMRQKKAHKI